MPITPNAEAKLNDGEREVLLLLANGHTSKTAAAELDLTENAVNERLRSARRKTGATSSRELARELYPQISCDEFSVVSNAGAMTKHEGRRFPIAGGGSITKGIVIMISLALAATVTAYLAIDPSDGVDAGSIDTALPQLAEPGMAMRDKLESERSDEGWALATQKELGSRFLALDGIALVAARCRTTLCEVNATVSSDNRTLAMRSIANKSFLEGLSQIGLTHAGVIDMRFVESEGDNGTITVFLERE